jgi:hypothetical protein
MESLVATLIEILLDPAVLVGAVVASFVLLSGLAARVVEVADGHRPSGARRPADPGLVTSDGVRDLSPR